MPGSVVAPGRDVTTAGPPGSRPTLAGHLRILRIDHWIKNVLVLPGIVVACAVDPARVSGGPLGGLLVRGLVGAAAICIVASSNYVLNEVLDAPSDAKHPTKHRRPVPSGQVSVPLAYAQWLVLGAGGVALGALISTAYALILVALWTMGCVYNIPPVRTKDVPYVDVLSEAVNNPLRMLAGWYIVGPRAAILPASLILSYWMIGAYFMAMKRFAEFRELGDSATAAGYRKSFAYYTEQRLLVSIMFYASASMLFLGSFIVRYRLELILAYPCLALVMAVYLDLAFKEDSAVQAPEHLHREPRLMAAVITCAVVMTILFFVDVPWLYRIFAPTLRTPGH